MPYFSSFYLQWQNIGRAHFSCPISPPGPQFDGLRYCRAPKPNILRYWASLPLSKWPTCRMCPTKYYGTTHLIHSFCKTSAAASSVPASGQAAQLLFFGRRVLYCHRLHERHWPRLPARHCLQPQPNIVLLFINQGRAPQDKKVHERWNRVLEDRLELERAMTHLAGLLPLDWT